MPFIYDASIINALENTISPDRLSSYVAATAGDTTLALELYAWNTEISAALYSPLQGLEIALRNVIQRELSALYGNDWYDNHHIPLTYFATHDIARAKQTLSKNGKAITPPNMVSELSFGFWVSLLSHGHQGAYHNKLWIPALHKGFPNLQHKKRKTVHNKLNYLRMLRNRIAHHEPIFKRHLMADYMSIIEVTGWMCDHTALWADHHNNFQGILASRPTL